MKTCGLKNDSDFFARVALFLLVAGLLGYLALVAMDASATATAFFAVFEIAALILGWVGRARPRGKIAVGGVFLLAAGYALVYSNVFDVRPTGGTRSRWSQVEPDTRPAFALDASKPFVIELGRGSGLYGLDIVKVNESGVAELHRMAGGQNVETASIPMSRAAVTQLLDLINSRHLTSMGRAYSDPAIADGTQWVLWIQQSPWEKSVYFNNAFPDQITGLADRLDALLQNAGLNNAKWTPVPRQKGTDEQTALWARTDPPK